MLDKIIKFSLTNRIIVLALAALITAYGLWSVNKLPVDVFPDLNRPTVNIVIESHGLAPEEVETLVSFPIETALNGLPGVERVRSSSGVGLSVIYVEFAWDTDIYRNRQMVQEKLSLTQERLPPGITPILGPISSIMGEIQFLGLSSPTNKQSPMELRDIADWTLRPRLMSIPGVSQVIAVGGGVRQYQILISAEKIQRLQLTIDSIEEKLSGLSINSTGGFIDLKGQEYLIRNIGLAHDSEEILNSVVGMHLGRPILVKEIAEVRMAPQTKRGDGSINGHPGVILSIQKQPGANTLELTEKIDQAVLEMSQDLPEGVLLDSSLFKQADFITTAISNVEVALRDGIILVIIVLFIFLLNLRTTAITLTAIPLSILLTAITFKLFGLSVNTMTLGGIAIAIGELVDDAIVDVENVFRRLKENQALATPRSSLKVVFEASKEVRNSIVIATLIVVLVFIPLFAMDGIEGRLFMPMGLSYIISLIASMIVSLTVTPILCSYFLPKAKLLNKQDGQLVQWLKQKQTKILTFLLDKPTSVFVISSISFLAAITVFLFIGKDFLPHFNEGSATISLAAKPGISLDESNNRGQLAEQIILKTPEVRIVSRRTGRAELDEHAEGVNVSEIEVSFHKKGRDRDLVLSEIRHNLEEIKDVGINIGQPISHRLDHLLSGVKAQIAIKVFGPELSVLRSKAAEIENLLGDIKGLVDLQAEQQVLIPQVKIHFLREEAAKYGISVGSLATQLEKALQGEVVGQILEGHKTIDIFMRFDEASRNDLELIQKTPVHILPDGSRVLVSDIADVYESTGPNIINRENAQRRIVIQANTENRSLDSVVAEIQEKINKKIELPAGYYITFGGQFESQQQANRTMASLTLISLLIIFIILWAHFKSIFISLQIMLNIPMAFIGGVFAIYLTNGTLSIASLVAFVTLCGIASRNGVMMLSHYIHLIEHEGETFSKQMVIRGSLERLSPVLMTALTAMLGLLPLALSPGVPGREILHPVAIVIVGGLVSSTLLDMFLTPAIFYKYGKRSALQSILKNKISKEEL